MSFGMFEAAISSDQEQGLARQASVDAKAAAVYDVREALGPVLFASKSVEEFRNKSAMMRKDGSVHKLIEPHLPPVTGVVRSIVGNNGQLEKEFKALLMSGLNRTAADDCDDDDDDDDKPFKKKDSNPWKGKKSKGDSDADFPKGWDKEGSYDPESVEDNEAQDEMFRRHKQRGGEGNPDPREFWDKKGQVWGATDEETGNEPGSWLQKAPKRTEPVLSRRRQADQWGDPDSWGAQGGVDADAEPRTHRKQKPHSTGQYDDATMDGSYPAHAPDATGLTHNLREYDELTKPKEARRRRAELEGEVKVKNTFKPSDDKLEPEGDWDAYRNKVDQNSDKVKKLFASTAFTVYADWCEANRTPVCRVASLDAYSANLDDATYMKLAHAIQAGSRTAQGVGELWKKWQQDHTGIGGEADYENFKSQFGVGDRAVNKLKQQHQTGPISMATRRRSNEIGPEDQTGEANPEFGQPMAIPSGLPDPFKTSHQRAAGEHGLDTADISEPIINPYTGDEGGGGAIDAGGDLRWNKPASRQSANGSTGIMDIPGPAGADGFTPHDNAAMSRIEMGHPGMSAWADNSPQKEGRRDPMQAYVAWCKKNGYKRISAKNVDIYSRGNPKLAMHLAVRMKQAIHVARVRQGKLHTAAPDYLQKADDALTQLLNQKAEEFQETIAPLQQALQTVQQATQLQQQQNPMNVMPPPGTVNVMPGQDPGTAGQIGMPDPNAPDTSALVQALAGGGGAPGGGGMPNGAAGPPPAAGGAPPDPSQQLQARRGGQGKGRGATSPRHAADKGQNIVEETIKNNWRQMDSAMSLNGYKWDAGGNAWQKPGHKPIRNHWMHTGMSSWKQDDYGHGVSAHTYKGDHGIHGLVIPNDHGFSWKTHTQSGGRVNGGTAPTADEAHAKVEHSANDPQNIADFGHHTASAHDYDPSNEDQIFAPARGHGWDHDSGPSGAPYVRPQLDEDYEGHPTPHHHEASHKQAWSGWGPSQFPKARKVAGWDWNDYLNGYKSNSPRQFECACGDPFPAPSGFHRCACGKQWNSYVIGSGGNHHEAAAEQFLVREIPTRDNVIVAANRQLNADAERTPRVPLPHGGPGGQHRAPGSGGRHETPSGPGLFAPATAMEHADPFLIQEPHAMHGPYGGQVTYHPEMHKSPGAPEGKPRHRATIQLVDPRTGAIHDLVEPGELGEGEDAGHPKPKKTPNDWHHRDKNQRWTS